MSATSERRFSFDASARMTPANVVTVARLLASPVLFVLILGGGASYLAFVLGFLIAATDSVDGYLARRWGVTRSGAFLDPLADKVLVLGSLYSLVWIDAFGALGTVGVVLITVREFGISAYRSYWARRGVAIPARRSAKAKTFVQELAIGLALLPPLERTPIVATSVLWVAVAFTLYSGGRYVADGRRAFSLTGDKPTGEPS